MFTTCLWLPARRFGILAAMDLLLGFGFAWIAALLAAFLAINVAEVGGLQGPALLIEALGGGGAASTAALLQPIGLSDGEVAVVNASLGSARLQDGTSTGEATGFRPGLEVSVTIASGSIASVTITGHHEVNSRFYARALQAVPAEIVAAQTTAVDTVSGATFTSVGIINAMNDALRQALVSGTLPKDLALPAGGRGRDRCSSPAARASGTGPRPASTGARRCPRWRRAPPGLDASALNFSPPPATDHRRRCAPR
jgi:uncharacterized protein with FMN-binding domain